MSDPLISVVEPENEDPFAWRERLSLRLTRAFLAVFSAVGVVVWFTMKGDGPRAALVGVAAFGALLCASPAFTGRPAGRRRSWFIVVPSVAAALIGFGMMGFIAGPAVLLSLMLLVSGLLRGLGSMIWLSALASMILLLIAAGMIHGTLPLPNPEDVSLRALRPWVRTIFVTFMVTGMLGAI